MLVISSVTVSTTPSNLHTSSFISYLSSPIDLSIDSEIFASSVSSSTQTTKPHRLQKRVKVNARDLSAREVLKTFVCLRVALDRLRGVSFREIHRFQYSYHHGSPGQNPIGLKCTGSTRNSKMKEKQNWASVKPKLENARRLRGISLIEPGVEIIKKCTKKIRSPSCTW